MAKIKDPDKVEKRLVALGKSADEVAEALRKKKIKGSPQRTHSCPVSRYVKILTGARWVSTGSSFIQYGDGSDRNLHFIITPLAVSDFIGCYDEGEYPDLISVDWGE